MYKTGAQASAFFDALLAAGPWTGPTRLVVCPPFTAIETCVAKARGSAVGVGGQDCYWEAEGAFTGQVAAGMLRAAGCGYVIVGLLEQPAPLGVPDDHVPAAGCSRSPTRP